MHRAEIDRRTEVEQEPGNDFSILYILPDVRRGHARGDIPIDIADVIGRRVFAQIGKVDTVPVKQAAIIALQQTIQTADDLPIEALQNSFRRWRGRWCVHAWAPRAVEFDPAPFLEFHRR